MKFINETGNSIYLGDIERYIPFIGEKEQDIDLDSVKKSKSFQSLILSGKVSITVHGDSRIERNLVRLTREFADSEDIPTEEEEVDSGDQIEVLMKGNFYEAGGYAKVNRNLANGLSLSDVKVQIKPLATGMSDLNELEVRQLSPMLRPVGMDAIKIDAIIPTFTEISHSRTYRILFTTVEAGSVPDQIVDICNQYDELWVVSDFCKEVLEKYGVHRPIYVMPNSINNALYNKSVEPHSFRPALKPFIFVSVFGWSYRKGWDALLKSYLREFTGDDPVSLLIISRYQGLTERSGVIEKEISSYIDRYGGDNPPHIARCSRVIPEHEMPSIYSACHCIVNCSRGEGFGLPMCEAALCGIPVISTNWSGQTMFLNEDNSYLVDVDRISPVARGSMHVHYWDNQLFAELRSDDFIRNFGETMRHVYVHYDEALEKNEILRSFIEDNYSISKAADRAKDRLEIIWDGVRSKQC